MNALVWTAIISMMVFLAITAWRDRQTVKEMTTEALFEELEARLKEDLREYQSGDHVDIAVIACLQGAIEHLANADMAYYASTK